jgi:hypothetical protein
LAPSLVAAVCLSICPGLNAADQCCAANAQACKGQPARFNKATGIVGMEVLNPKGKRLGEIKDVVFDLKSERVAYAVLGTAGSPQKLVAVPLSALAPAADGEHLTLRADAAKLATAKGLADGNWPAPVNPAWGAQAPETASQPLARVSLPRR